MNLLKKITINVSGQANLENIDRTSSKFHSLKISFSGDVLIEDCPQTIDQVMKIYRSVPSLIKSLNDGKGKQLTYTLCSLKQIADMTKFERNITKLVENFQVYLSQGTFFRIRIIADTTTFRSIIE